MKNFLSPSEFGTMYYALERYFQWKLELSDSFVNETVVEELKNEANEIKKLMDKLRGAYFID